MKLAVCTDWGDKKSAFFWNKDGILRMLQLLRDRDNWETRFFRRHPEHTFVWNHDYIDAYLSPDPAKAVREWNPDVILFFGDFSRPIMGALADMKVPKAICYSGGRFTEYATVPDLVFTESKSYIPWMKANGVKQVIQAFGTNTKLFKPYPDQPKFFDAFFPATFAGWKRHDLFVDAMGKRGVTCGWWQENEMGIVENIMKRGTGILHHQMAESMALLYSMAKTVVVTSSDVGGSQRTVLEALACNVPCMVMNDSTMTSEYVIEAGHPEWVVDPRPEAIRTAVDDVIKLGVRPNTRDWVMKNYSEYIYADKVRDGILSLMK
jgi:glycosyltransferase involved in cell wall biosynthesis